MKPKDLTLEQLKAIPLDEFRDNGIHKKISGMICDDCYLPEETTCNNTACADCPLDTPKAVKQRIKELQIQKDGN